ncbi:hypothetical protein ABZT26_03040 [Streptomyces sp. NPDC005395]|uniref:hypothetical protein n=1 Tax=unclassified Streptomyces TaxID=2593676 RepID=UPI001F25379F|nr:hypothetical protein [Streptomyces sp. BSE6.1]
MIAEAIDTVCTLGVVLLLWIAVALCTPVVLLTGWALRLLLSRVVSALRGPDVTRLLPDRLRRHLKRWRHARQWRDLEAYAFNLAPVPVWSRIRTLNDAARIWRRHPEHPRKEPRP